MVAQASTLVGLQGNSSPVAQGSRRGGRGGDSPAEEFFYGLDLPSKLARFSALHENAAAASSVDGTGRGAGRRHGTRLDGNGTRRPAYLEKLPCSEGHTAEVPPQPKERLARLFREAKLVPDE